MLTVPAIKKLRLDPYSDTLRAELDETRSMFELITPR